MARPKLSKLRDWDPDPEFCAAVNRALDSPEGRAQLREYAQWAKELILQSEEDGQVCLADLHQPMTRL